MINLLGFRTAGLLIAALLLAVPSGATWAQDNTSAIVLPVQEAYSRAEAAFTASPPDYIAAKRWYQVAAEQGHGLSQLRLGFLNAESHFTGLTPDKAVAEHWFKKAAEQNAGDARFRLGTFYLHYKTPPEPENAFLWLSRAAEGGHRVAMFDLARLYLDGTGTTQNSAEGLKWLLSAAEADVQQAQTMLAELHLEGRHVPKDPGKAVQWLKRGADKPSASVFQLNQLGDMFFGGTHGVPRHYPTARTYYERAAAKGDAHAQKRLDGMQALPAVPHSPSP